jgi:iron complex transport system substrate-binding protein
MAEQQQPRVLSLLSAASEIVHRLGMGHAMVGRSHGCDDPPLATTLPPCTAPYVDPNAVSEDIDTQVRAVAAGGGPVYHIYNDQLAKLRPTVIIAQNQCRICAVTAEDVANACQSLPDCTIVTIQPTTLDDVLNDVSAIANAIGVQKRGERLVRHLREGFDDVRKWAAEVAGSAPRPKVCHLEWLAPLMGSGYWIHECVDAAGGDMVHGSKGGNSGTLSAIGELADADVIIIAPCGFTIERTEAELSRLEIFAEPAWQALPAVVSGRVFVADGNLYYNRSSCGVLETAQMTAECIWPELTGFWGHHGQRVVRLDELAAFCTRPGAPASCYKPARVEQPAVQQFVPKEHSLEATDIVDSAASSAPPPSAAALGPREVVIAQLEALLVGDFAAAYALNSKANQDRLGSAKNFAHMVKMSGSFGLLAVAGRTVELTPQSEGGGRASIGVYAVSPDRQACSFVFDLIQGETSALWSTDGVRIEC